MSYAEQHKYPRVLLSRYDEFYNIWQYCEDGYVYCYSNSNQPVGYRPYEQWELQQFQQYQNYN